MSVAERVADEGGVDLGEGHDQVEERDRRRLGERDPHRHLRRHYEERDPHRVDDAAAVGKGALTVSEKTVEFVVPAAFGDTLVPLGALSTTVFAFETIRR